MASILPYQMNSYTTMADELDSVESLKNPNMIWEPFTKYCMNPVKCYDVISKKFYWTLAEDIGMVFMGSEWECCCLSQEGNLIMFTPKLNDDRKTLYGNTKPELYIPHHSERTTWGIDNMHPNEICAFAIVWSHTKIARFLFQLKFIYAFDQCQSLTPLSAYDLFTSDNDADCDPLAKHAEIVYKRVSKWTKTMTDAMEWFTNRIKGGDERIASYESRISELESSHKAQISELESSYESRIGELESSHKAQIDDLESSYESRISKLESSHKARISELESQQKTTVNFF